MSLVEDKVPIVKIVRDTGPSDSFILRAVLPFSADSNSGDGVLFGE